MTITRSLTINQPQIGKLIRELRLENGLTYSSMNRWENGRTKPSPLAMQKVEGMLRLRGDRGKEMRVKHFSSEV